VLLSSKVDVVEKKIEVTPKPQVAVETPTDNVVKTASKPLSRPKTSSGFSINSFINKEEKQEVEEMVSETSENLQEHHFTETDLQSEWNLMLMQLRTKDPFIFNAIKSFKLVKIDEKLVQVLYPSESARAEFDKISGEFFNHFKRKVNNYAIKIEYKQDVQNLKIEVLTTKKKFERFVEINPLLKDLDDLMKFDLT
jgi:DNA polymerase-3 subunit gamma/tau